MCQSVSHYSSLSHLIVAREAVAPQNPNQRYPYRNSLLKFSQFARKRLQTPLIRNIKVVKSKYFTTVNTRGKEQETGGAV